MGLSDPTGGVERLGETLTPVVDLWSRPEWALLRDERWGAGTAVEVAGGVGIVSHVQLFNPAGSGVLCVVHSISTMQTVNVWLLDTALATPRNTSPIDGRLDLSSTGIGLRCRVRSTVNAGSLGTQISRLASGSHIKEIPMVLFPGNGIHVTTTADNLDLVASFVFYERPLLPGEDRLG